jgi:4-diphosphocytidyl-2-C-methyl-D-erythritol kinase
MSPRQVRVPSFAKLNLTLKVLGKRPDGYHELRTVFQTISVKDTIQIEFERARKTNIEAICKPHIPDNIAIRAASIILDELKLKARVQMRIMKKIPMGGGLGGGSSNAAAVLLALPALAGRRIAMDRLLRIAAALGSDVPFFLMGGTALGLSRGEELYPFPEPGNSSGMLITSGIHVSTPNAYKDLARGQLTVTGDSRIINRFQSLSWEIGEGRPVQSWRGFCQNDFEPVVFSQYPQIRRLKRKLQHAGSSLALMTGSGSTLFGFFDERRALASARTLFPATWTVPFQTVSRKAYQSRWWRSLAAHAQEHTWPPLSRYAK